MSAATSGVVAYPKLLEQSSTVVATRGEMAEIIGALIEITKPRARLSRSETRGKIFSSIGELLWYLTRDNRLDFIEGYLSQYREESEDKITVYGGYTRAIKSREAAPNRADPRSSYFEPERAAAFHARRGQIDEAIWLIFLATHFGQHGRHGWRIDKRVSPKAAAEFSRAQNLPQLVALELEILGDQIRLYPYTARYREAINLASKDMVAAWLLHSHSLRQSELYIIQERSTDLLRFLRNVSQDLGLAAAPDRSKSFEKAFKRRFERRLRERHRLVHAHERPSLTSRVIDFGVAAKETDKDIVEDSLADLFIKMASLLPGEPPKDAQELMQKINKLRDSHVDFAYQEATDMFDMLAFEVGTTLGTPFAVQAQDSPAGAP